MMFLLLMAISVVIAAAVYLSLSRDIFRVIIGLTLLGAAVNLIVFAAGRFSPLIAPLLDNSGDAAVADVADPLVQALVLTAIVISFALMCFALVLGARLRTSLGSSDVQQMHNAEPTARDPSKAPELED